ncbi:hypothetical protein NC652_009985 [Populus alba x Populus x berolinensis]|nr:hypothetical protein NC652_009985 [Populus alba x Populus x berolinensis]
MVFRLTCQWRLLGPKLWIMPLKLIEMVIFRFNGPCWFYQSLRTIAGSESKSLHIEVERLEKMEPCWFALSY